MPVEEHEVHEKVKIDDTFRYGCNSVRNPNRAMKGYHAPQRHYRPDGTFYIALTFIEYKMSKPCRSFYLWDTDPGCADCKTERDTEYADKMRVME